MKKIIAFLLAAAMVLCFAGCTTTNTPETTAALNGNEPVQDSFSCTYNGVTIALHAPAADILAALGDHNYYLPTQSCAFEGLDKVYGYGSLYLQTYPIGDKDYIAGWWFEDDVDEDAHTPEGIRLDSTQAEVEAAYGTEGYNGTNAFEIIKGSGKLTITLENGKVDSIQYSIITD